MRVAGLTTERKAMLATVADADATDVDHFDAICFMAP